MAKVSVLMGVYNCEKYVEESINSILGQTFTDFEFIICDDGSTDNTKDVVKRSAQKDSRIIFVENDGNHGLAYTLNHALEYATGEFIIRSDGDDISLPQRFERLLSAMEENPEYVVIGSGVDLFDENGVWGEAIFSNVPDTYDAFMNRTLSHATVIMKTSALRAVGGYDVAADAARAEDYDLWCRLTLAGYKLMSIPDKLYQVRWDKKGYYSRRPLKTRLALARLVRKWHKKMHLGFKGETRVIVTYAKAFIPSFIKNIYHRIHLSN